MESMLTALGYVAALAFPFVAMPLMWRRMKRVQAQTYSQSKAPPRDLEWQEPLETSDGLTLAKAHRPNDELIDLGDKARHGRWPLDNQ